MPIVLNHTIVPAKDKIASAEFIGRMLGCPFQGLHGHFAPVQVNDSLTLDFDDRDEFDSHHYAFHVSDEEFDTIFGRLKAESVAYGSGPRSQDDGEINTRRGGRGLYFQDANGHSWELMTRV